MSNIVSSSDAGSVSSHTNTPRTAPTIGKMMNTQSCPSAFGEVSAKIAVAMLRAGLTLVLSTGIVTKWIKARVIPATRPPNPGANCRVVVASTA